MVTVLDRAGNKINILNGRVNLADTDGSITVFADDARQHTICMVSPTGNVILAKGADYTIEPALGPTKCPSDLLIQQLQDDKRRGKVPLYNLQVIKKLLTKFNSKSLAWQR